MQSTLIRVRVQAPLYHKKSRALHYAHLGHYVVQRYAHKHTYNTHTHTHTDMFIVLMQRAYAYSSPSFKRSFSATDQALDTRKNALPFNLHFVLWTLVRSRQSKSAWYHLHNEWFICARVIAAQRWEETTTETDRKTPGIIVCCRSVPHPLGARALKVLFRKDAERRIELIELQVHGRAFLTTPKD